VRLFEVGTVFAKGAAPAPVEHTAVAAVLTGARHPRHWADGGQVPDMDIWDLKAHFVAALRVAAPGARLQLAGGSPSPGLWEAVGVDGSVVGWAGPLEADRPAWAGAGRWWRGRA
jgi:hypothetical protein